MASDSVRRYHYIVPCSVFGMLFSLFTRVTDDAAGILGVVPRAIGGVLDDIRRMADQLDRMVELVSHLPDLDKHLASIDRQVKDMDDEVTAMRKGVQKINDQVDEMNEILVEELQQVTMAVHPLRRTRARFGRSGRAAKPDSDAS